MRAIVPERPIYIAVSGNVCVGKTTLVNSLAHVTGWKPFIEDPDSNPFLALAYANPHRWGLASQAWFLAAKQAQLEAITLNAGISILDRSIYENDLFARLHLDKAEYASFASALSSVVARQPRPVLLVYLEASVDEIVRRLRNRAKPYEEKLSLQTVRCLAEQYESWVATFDACPVVRFKSAEQTKLLDDVIEVLREWGEVASESD